MAYAIICAVMQKKVVIYQHIPDPNHNLSTFIELVLCLY